LQYLGAALSDIDRRKLKIFERKVCEQVRREIQMKNEDKPESNERYYKFFINLLDLFGVPQKLLCGFFEVYEFFF